MEHKTILVNCAMFTKAQTVYVVENDQVIETVSATIDNISDTVNALATRYDIRTVNIKGAKMFTKKIGNEIKEDGITQYNRNLIINFIK